MYDVNFYNEIQKEFKESKTIKYSINYFLLMICFYIRPVLYLFSFDSYYIKAHLLINIFFLSYYCLKPTHYNIKVKRYYKHLRTACYNLTGQQVP
jgi:hypothetical protein